MFFRKLYWTIQFKTNLDHKNNGKSSISKIIEAYEMPESAFKKIIWKIKCHLLAFKVLILFVTINALDTKCGALNAIIFF